MTASATQPVMIPRRVFVTSPRIPACWPFYTPSEQGGEYVVLSILEVGWFSGLVCTPINPVGVPLSFLSAVYIPHF